MKDVADELQSILQGAETLRNVNEQTASVRPGPGKWSKKEILGHLIDSAANNHQRFIRLQLSTTLELPGYDQDAWVHLGRYQQRRWPEIIDLWLAYNNLLVGVIRAVDPKALQNVWRMPDGKEVNLEFIIRDYTVHMRHHLEQIL